MEIENYDDYYVNQAGHGKTVYEGYQYQRGHGFFGSLFANLLTPLGKYLGKQALSTGVRMGADVLSGTDARESLRKNLNITKKQILNDGADRLKTFAQTGKGKRKSSIKAKPNKIRTSLRKKKSSSKVKRKNAFRTKFHHIFE